MASARVVGLSLAMACLPLGSIGTASAAQKTKSFKTEWHVCHGRAPLETGCTFKTRFRGWPDRDRPVPTIVLNHLPRPEDPLARVPFVCTPAEACVADSFHGTLTVSVVGRARGFVTSSATWINNIPTGTYRSKLSWSRWEHLTVTVTASGLDPGLPPLGPWEARIGIRIPTRAN